MNREARRLEKEIKEVLEEMSSDQEAKVGYYFPHLCNPQLDH